MTENEKKLHDFIKRVNRTKQNLVNKAESTGSTYENFGQKEYRKLLLYIDISDYSPAGKAMRQVLDNFNQWCMTYSPRLRKG